MTLDSERILIAEIATAHGIRGLVKLRLFCEDPSLVDEHGPLFTHETGPKTLKITLDKLAGTVWLARIDGVHDRTAAEKLRGTKLYLNRDQLPEIDEDGTYYHTDLLDLQVRHIAGHLIGTVANIVNFGASDLIDIQPAEGPSFYLPFTDDFVLEIDIENGFISIQNHEAFLPDPPQDKKQRHKPKQTSVTTETPTDSDPK